MPTTKPKAPAGLARRGAAFWREIAAAYELTPAERELLLEICRTLDVVETLNRATDRGSLIEARQQRLALGRLLAQLEIPDPEGTIERPVKRRARQAAEKRWATPIRREA